MCFVKFKDNTDFARDFIRIVSGGRGKYMELRGEDIVIPLKSKFNQNIPKEISQDYPYFYYWLEPVGRNEKIYWQAKTVNYADYKIGLYYIDPKLVIYESKTSLLR